MTSKIVSSSLHALIFSLSSVPVLLNFTSVHFLDFPLVLGCFPSLSDTRSSSKRLVNSLNSSKKLPLFPAFHHLLNLYLLSSVEFSPPPVRPCVINAVLPFSSSHISSFPSLKTIKKRTSRTLPYSTVVGGEFKHLPALLGAF